MNPYNRRLATFSVCSSDLKLSPLQLARKGFRYDNNNFMVICDDCLVSIDNLNIAGGIGHHPGCPNFEENYTVTHSASANKVLSTCKSATDFQLACLPETILEQTPWKSEVSSSSRTADESEDRSNHVNGFSRYSTGETPVTLDDGDDRELTPEWTCKICLDTEVSVVFLPCGHLVSCDQCATRLRICPICRTRILKTITALMA